MGTLRNIISDIRSISKLLSSDQLINDRIILNEILSVSTMIVGQGLNKRKYWQSFNIFTPVHCIQMEETPLSECCEYTNNCMIAKSVTKLPKIGESSLSASIQGIFSVDGKKKFKETNPNRFANILKLGLPNLGIYFWVMNDHLYITNPDTKAVNGYFYFTEIPTAEFLYPTGCDCKPDPPLTLQCQNPLDQEFHFVAGREYDLKQLVYKNLLSIYFSLPVEKDTNGRDDTSK